MVNFTGLTRLYSDGVSIVSVGKMILTSLEEKIQIPLENEWGNKILVAVGSFILESFDQEDQTKFTWIVITRLEVGIFIAKNY